MRQDERSHDNATPALASWRAGVGDVAYALWL
jgi:hypothetical protein